MQIDYHHTTTYVLSRLAGFTQTEARTVAHAAQYVDDATNGGRITFTNGGAYSRISSAHSRRTRSCSRAPVRIASAIHSG